MTVTTSYLTMLEKATNTTQWSASESNEIKDALTDGTKSIYTQSVKTAVASYSASGAIAIGGFASMDSSGGELAMTVANPSVGGIDLTITLATAGNDATVTFATAGALDGTNEIAVFDTAQQTLVLKSISSTRWTIIKNEGSVALST